MRERKKRSQFIVDKGVQYKFIGLSIGYACAICLVSIFGLQILSRQIVDTLDQTSSPPEVSLQIIEKINLVSLQFIGLTAVVLLFAWFGGLYFSNRIAGPIYGMMRTIDRYLEGDREARVQTREKDYFTPLADKINDLLSAKSNAGK